mmetsp:Transcript_125432/g.297865  ORF Transcript_125432/g.297865 Transcript_125432/m.297865 type:complete len:299 (+) Transcript_125432:673-1569(+)
MSQGGGSRALRHLLPRAAVHRSGRVQHLPLCHQRHEERVPLHAHGLPFASHAPGLVCAFQRLPQGRRPEQLHLLIQRQQGPGPMHRAGVSQGGSPTGGKPATCGGRRLLPRQELHRRRRLQHLQVRGQRSQERVRVHSDGLPPLDGYHRELHGLQHLPGRGRLEHLRLPGGREEERRVLHQLEVPRAKRGRGRPLLPGCVLPRQRRLQHLRLPRLGPDVGGRVHADGLPAPAHHSAARPVHSLRGLPQGRRHQHLHLPCQRPQQRGALHPPAVPGHTLALKPEARVLGGGPVTFAGVE